FHRFEPAVKEGVFYSIYQIWNNAIESESKPFFASVNKSVIKSKNLSNPVDFTFSQIFVYETVSDAVDWLSVDANDLLSNIPIAHFSPQGRPVYTLSTGSFASNK